MHWLLALLLRLYPRSVRDRDGAEMLGFWRAQAREPRYRGLVGRGRLVGHLAGDAIRRGLGARVRARREGDGMVGQVASDLRSGVRALRAAPLFGAMTVVTLALGIGASTAVFSVVDNVVLRPLPYPESARLVRVLRTVAEGDTPEVSWPDFRDWREQASDVVALAGYTESESTFEWEGAAETLSGARVTRDYFDVMGVGPALGRSFTEEEDRMDGPGAIILSHGLWMERFGGDPDVLERSVPIEGGSVPVVGVMPAGFDAPDPGLAYWEPMQDDELLRTVGLPTGTRTLSFISVVGRLGDGVAPESARARLASLAAAIDREAGKSDERLSHPALVPLLEELVGGVRAMLYLLLGAAGLVLLVACANVASLSLSRAAARDRELAVRCALGAPRGRLVRQLLSESFVLATLAGALGVAVAVGLQTTLVGLAPAGLPRVDAIRMDAPTLGFAVGATLLSGLLFGLLPAVRSSRAGDLLVRGLTGARGSSAGTDALAPQKLLVSLQVAVAVVLLVGAALTTGSFSRLVSVDLGFDAEPVVLASVAPGAARYGTPAELTAFYERLLDEVRRLPDVESASTTYSPPLVGNGFRTSIVQEGVEEDRSQRLWAGTVVVGDGYFEANGIPLLRGRAFDGRDRLGEPPVAIVSETLAERLWPGEDPLGKRFEFTGGVTGSADSFDRAFFPAEPYTVVGVAGDVRRRGLADPPAPEYYRPHAQITWGFQYLVVRTSRPVDDLAGTLRRTVWSIDPTVPVRTVRTMASHVAEAAAAPRFRMLLLLVFAGLTGALSMVGLYAVTALAVARRTREVGIRVALGASRAAVLRGVLAGGLRLVALGLAGGLGVAWWGSRALASMLFGLTPTDPATYVGVALLVALVALAACWLPARRAARVDPVRSLQAE